MFLGSAIILLFIIYFYNYVVINVIIVNNAVTVTYLYCYHYCRYYAQFIPFYSMIFSTVSQIGPIHKGSGNQGLSIWEGGTHPFPGVESVWSIFLQSLENKAEKKHGQNLCYAPMSIRTILILYGAASPLSQSAVPEMFMRSVFPELAKSHPQETSHFENLRMQNPTCKSACKWRFYSLMWKQVASPFLLFEGLQWISRWPSDSLFGGHTCHTCKI